VVDNLSLYHVPEKEFSCAHGIIVFRPLQWGAAALEKSFERYVIMIHQPEKEDTVLEVKDQWVDLKEASRITGRSVTALRLLINRKKIDRIKKIHSKGQGYWLIHQEALESLMSHDRLSDASAREEIEGDEPDFMESPELNHTPAMSQLNHVMTLAFDHIERQRKEWEGERDKLMQGLLMYRVKFEELDKQVKQLPAPPEYVRTRMEDLERHLDEVKKEKNTVATELGEKVTLLAREKEATVVALESSKSGYEDALSELRAKLEEEARMKEELRRELEIARDELTVMKQPWWKKRVW
jgi:hypothetical protein